jgi:hypothetical protein
VAVQQSTYQDESDRMQFTDKEHEETLASCRAKAQDCRNSAAKMQSPDNRAEMEKTAAMWDEMARSIEAAQVSSPVEKLFAKPSRSRTDYDESGR